MGLIPIHEIVVLIVDYSLHRALECIVPLLYRLYEPFCRIQLLLDEYCRLLLLPFGRIGRFHEDVGIFPVDPQLRNGETRHREFQLAVLHRQHKIRDYLLRLVVI